MRTRIFLILSMMITTACTQNNAPQPGEVNVEYTPKHINLIRPIVEPEKIYRMSLWDSRYNYLPEEMAKMRNLRRLVLGNVEIKDWESSVGTIQKLHELRELKITGASISKLHLNHLKLPKLEELDLFASNGYNLESEIIYLTKFPHLKSLVVAGMNVNQLPNNITSLENLEYFEFGDHNEGFDYSEALILLSNLPKLKYLFFSIANIDNALIEFQQLENIQKLGFYDCSTNLDTIFKVAGQWKNLESLELLSMDLIRLPDSFTGLQRLKSLSLYHNPDLDHASLFRQLAKLPHLEELDISETVDYQKDTLFHLPKEIGMLKNLRKLEMEYMYRVDYANLIEQIKDLPHLETLSLYNSQHYIKYFSDLRFHSFPASIKELKSLKNLDVGRTNVGIFENVEELPELTSLNCSQIGFEPSIPKVVFNTTSLKSLNLNDCKLKEFPKGILKLKELEHLDLGNNQIRELPEAITQLKNLKYLNLMGTIISTSQEKRDKIEKMLPNTLVFFGEYRAYDPDWMDK